VTILKYNFLPEDALQTDLLPCGGQFAVLLQQMQLEDCNTYNGQD
jgi:hypothetical protein